MRYKDAACLGLDTNLFFDKDLYTSAKLVCENCPIKQECLEECLAAEDIPINGARWRSGVFGGTTPTQRNNMQGTNYGVVNDNSDD